MNAPMWQGEMTLAQLEIIERTFATFTRDGWCVPQWVHSLRLKIMKYAIYRNQQRA